MASVADQLGQIAFDEAARMQYERPALEAELLEIEARKREIEAKLDATKFALKRANNFLFKVGVDYQCPRCWVRHENRTTLRCLPSDVKNDFFACDTCGLDAEIVMGA